jgi:CubicO group peptidase (beta-lactamase class C family)
MQKYPIASHFAVSMFILSTVSVTEVSAQNLALDGKYRQMPQLNSTQYEIYEPAAIIFDSVGLDSFIQAEMDARHIPGAATCAIKNGEIIWSTGHGWAIIEDSIPVTDTTLFMLASVSKTITAVALMQLWDQNAFELDDDINDYLPFEVHNPNFPDSAITFRHLLTHTSSITDNWSAMPYSVGDSPIPLGEYLTDYLVPGGAYYDSSLNFGIFPPGTQMSYSNVAVALAGYMVEAIADSFPIWCEDSIFTPLDMYETGWFLANLDTNNIAVPYHWQGSGYTPYEHYGYPDYPSGQLRTSSSQLARFLIAFQQYGIIDTTRILDSATVALMTTVQYPQLNQHQGLIWYKTLLDGRWVWGHDGGDSGVHTRMYYCPTENTAAIVLTNGESMPGGAAIIDALFDYALDYGIEEYDEQKATVHLHLSQNRPNPFKNTTVIDFTLSENSHTNLSVYNAAGRKVAVLIDAHLPAGTHSVVFDSYDLPAGVYVYRFQAGGMNLTKRCVVLK